VETTPRPATIIRHGRIGDATSHTATPADILVVGDAIAAIGPPGLPAPDGALVVDASRRLLLPGLVNAHFHSHGGLAKSLGDRWTLELLQNYGAWTTTNRTVEDKHLSARIAAVELLERGCTACYDLVYEFPAPTVEGMAGVAQAYRDVGMRAVLAPLMADHTLYEAVPPFPRRSGAMPSACAAAEANVTALRAILERWRFDRSEVGIAIAPTVPLQRSDEFLIACRDLRKKFGVGIHSRVNEARLQGVRGQDPVREDGDCPSRRSRLLGPAFTAAHGVWLEDDDVRRRADRGSSVAHNPGANLRLGSGLAYVPTHFPLQ
jgi:guanine deaminase